MAGVSASQTDPRPHFEAAKTTLDIALSPHKAYRLDSIPGTAQNPIDTERNKPLPKIYVELGVEPRYVPPAGAVPRSRRGGWRLTTRYAGSTYNEALWAMSRIEHGLRNRHLLVEGERVGPVIRESGQQPEWDNVRYTGLLVWTYSH